MGTNYGEETRLQIEQELGTKIYPGTEIMQDVGSHRFVKSSVSSKNVLVPQPSNNIHDPLNWNRRWKFSVIFLGTALSFSQGLGPLALAPMFPELMESFQSDLASVVRFTGVCILVLGFSNFIWVPMSQTFGRRPVAILSCLVCLTSMIWRAKATTYNSFMGACVLNGIGAGPAESLQPQVIADTQFLHDRGAYITLYFTFYYGSLMVGPIISGPMAYHVGWPNFWWFNVALLGSLTVLLVFFFPETKWHRDQAVQNSSPASEKSQRSPIIKDEVDSQPTEIEKSKTEEEVVAPLDEWLFRGHPSKSQFYFWKTSPEPLKTMAVTFWIPWKLHFYPIVEFAAFVISWSSSVFLTVNLTQSQAFAAPPYGWSSQSIGFTNFATFIGALIGLATNGPLSDWISMRATRRNNGIREPEMRLPAMIPYVLIAILGNFVVAFGYQYHWDWRAIVIIGYTCSGIQVAALPAITSTYAVDSYKPIAGSVFVNMTINKNLWGYGFSEFITVWTTAAGYVSPIMMNMCLHVLWCSFGIVFYFYGKQCRKWTAKSNVHHMNNL